MLNHNGYRYTELNKKNGRVTWRCAFRQNARYVCKSYATTFYVGPQQRASFRGRHCHAP